MTSTGRGLILSSDRLKTRIWISDGTDYNFPETHLPAVMERPPIGVCFSGGGTRSMSATMGQMRALNKLGLLKQMRYISCVSGGSWASTIYTYYASGARGDEDLLGPITPPGEITRRHLRTTLTPSRLAFPATDDLTFSLLEWAAAEPFYPYTLHDVWIYGVGQTFLERFGIFNTHVAANEPRRLPYFTWDRTIESQIKACNPSLDDHPFHRVRPDRPYLIVNATIIPGDDTSPWNLLGFEYGPLAVGRPFLIAREGRCFGGGYIEPFAYRSRQPASGPTPGTCADALGSSGWVEVSGQDRPFALADATGTSSAAFAAAALQDLDSDAIDPQAFYWAVESEGPYRGDITTFGDGGLLENYGIISLILRGLPVAIVFINTQTKLDLEYSPNQDPTDVANDPDGKCDVYLPGLFGYANPAWDFTYPQNHVFDSGELAPLISHLQAKKQRREPLIVTRRHKVVRNDNWGVEARADPMTVVWCYLDRVPTWERHLGSRSIRRAIRRGNPRHGKAKGPFAYFPNYLTVFQNSDFRLVELTPEQVVLSADLTADNVLTEKHAFLEAMERARSA